MDLQGIPKLAYRERIIVAYKDITGETSLPDDQCFFTLGGPIGRRGKVIHGSELDHLVQRSFIRPEQYFSVERDQKIHRANTLIRGPRWMEGQLASNFDTYGYGDDLPGSRFRYLGCMHADLMCGAIKALPTVRSILDTYHEMMTDDSGQSPALFVFNMCQKSRWYENCGGRADSMPDVAKTVMRDPAIKWHLNRGMELVDRYTYENKTVGYGSGAIVMTALMFWY